MQKDHLILKVDYDKNNDIANAYGAAALPYFVIVQNGMILERITGVTDESKLRTSLTDPNEGKYADSIISSATPPRPE